MALLSSKLMAPVKYNRRFSYILLSPQFLIFSITSH
jgi:hypothetical protein